MTEIKKSKKRPREELTLKQKVYIGIAIFVLFLILLFKVIIPQYALMEGRRIADEINNTIRIDHFELINAERKGIQFFASFQSTVHEDLVISSDLAPRQYTSHSIRFLYERAVEQKALTIRRFDMATSDILYEALKPELGDRLLRIMGKFGPEAREVLELDEEFQLGKLRSYVPTVDIQESPSDEKYLEYLEIILKELNTGKYGFAGVNIQFTEDREQQTTYSWQGMDGQFTIEKARSALEAHRREESVEGFRITGGTYFDYPYNFNFTTPPQK